MLDHASLIQLTCQHQACLVHLQCLIKMDHLKKKLSIAQSTSWRMENLMRLGVNQDSRLVQTQQPVCLQVKTCGVQMEMDLSKPKQETLE